MDTFEKCGCNKSLIITKECLVCPEENEITGWQQIKRLNKRIGDLEEEIEELRFIINTLNRRMLVVEEVEQNYPI